MTLLPWHNNNGIDAHEPAVPYQEVDNRVLGLPPSTRCPACGAETMIAPHAPAWFRGVWCQACGQWWDR